MLFHDNTGASRSVERKISFLAKRLPRRKLNYFRGKCCRKVLLWFHTALLTLTYSGLVLCIVLMKTVERKLRLYMHFNSTSTFANIVSTNTNS